MNGTNSAMKSSWFVKLALPSLPLLALVLMVGYTYQKNTAKTAIQAEAEHKRLINERMSWPLRAPPPRATTVPQSLTVPKLPAVIYVRQPDGSMAMDRNSLLERLKIIVQTHPIDEIKLELNTLVMSGAIGIDFRVNEGLVAEMTLVPVEHVSYADPNIAAGKKFQPIMSVNPEWLANLKTSDDITLSQLVIFHEFHHYKDFIDTNGADRRMWEERSNPNTLVTQTDACKMMWRSENSAYAAECRLANDWGASSLVFGGLCGYVDSPQWDHAMFQLMIQNPQLRPKCGRPFATDAKHPYPEYF